MQWSDEDRESIYHRGLAIRAVASGVFVGFFGAVWISSAGDQVSGMAGIITILISLIGINLPLWIIGRSRGFPLEDFRWHWGIDMLGVTGVIYYLGVLDFPLAVTGYMIMIVSSATFGSRATARWMAHWAALCLLMLILADESGGVGHFHLGFAPHLNGQGKMVVGLGSVALFYVFGYLGGELATQLREKTEEIDSQRTELEAAYGKVQNAHDRMVLLSTLVRHDLYSPLGVVSGACQEAVRSCESGRLPEAKHFITMIGTHLQSIEGAVETLGLLGADESIEGEECSLETVVIKLLDDLAGECEDRRVSVSYEGEWPYITVRTEEFYHVLRNLVSNSIKAVESDGTGRVVIVGRQEEGACEVVVIDNGPGISQGLEINLRRTSLPRTERERSGGGFGIGLALASNVARGWGGEIRYGRGKSGGSEFVIRVPERCTRWVS